ncbi:hypothetical protein [Sulfurirhabdus autotrophica]|uniref:DUF4381 domain-containing protein n=1 Tax=Sulfurirhabdus autotrophica TaxID=1706046 RepID=A0A4R3XUV3_9PROT|nr:hypothetical protein [Sulfurirhabdus autotrophica]TCV82531.1 hypothetical protein EDC63_12025 [Sulfurirhabdus autotrophica]
MNESVASLIDIIDPVAPLQESANSVVWLAAGIVCSVLLVAGIIFWWRKKKPARLAVKRLKALRLHVSAGELSSHEMVFMVAMELRRGLSLARLLPETPPLGFQREDVALWSSFVQLLDTLRYAPDVALDNQQLEAIFAQTEIWLRRYSL